MKTGYKGLVLVLLYSLFWAFDVIISKLAFFRGAEPFSYYSEVFFLSALFLLTFVFVFKEKQEIKLNKRDIPVMLLFGFIANGIGGLVGTYGLSLSTASNYGFLIKSTVIFVVILSFLFFKEKLTVRKLFFSALLMIGAYLISTKGAVLKPMSGDLFILLSSLCFAIVIVFSKNLLNTNSPEYLSFFRSLAGGFTLLFVSFILGKPLFQMQFFPYVLLNSLFVSLLFLAMYKALEIKSASYISMVSMTFSVLVAIIAFFILGEKMSSVQILGGFFIMLSVILIERLRI